MKIRNIKHKALRRLVEDDNRTGFQPQIADKLLKMVAFLQDVTGPDLIQDVPSWKAHQLTGDRKGTWAFHVTKNWRLTFDIDRQELDIIDLDYEDYH